MYFEFELAEAPLYTHCATSKSFYIEAKTLAMTVSKDSRNTAIELPGCTRKLNSRGLFGPCRHNAAP